MGLCFSTRVEAGRSPENGENPEIEFEGGNNMNVSGDPTEDKILKFDDLREFSFSELRAATGFSNKDSLLGIGAFGSVYKGWIDMHSLTAAKPGTGMAIAVKVLMPRGTLGQQDWLAEIMHLGRLEHPNLVKLYGHCIDNCHRLLVYEFMPNGSLDYHLFRGCKVALGAAKGLAFLHNKAHVIHQDFKTYDILLDLKFNAKISDFGLAKEGPTSGRSHVSTRASGDHEYASPEYILKGHVSTNSDVYSFGVVLLEVLTGQVAVDPTRPKGQENMILWATPYLNNKSKVFQLLDTCIADYFPPTSVLQVAKLVVCCLSEEPKLRPDMEEVAKEPEEILGTI